ncbi:MAG: AAA family ATPase [Bacteroidales bacterium]|nr:AAA family ATPase [Bacteroidales bacterium]
MEKNAIKQLLVKYFKYTPTPDQGFLIDKLAGFLLSFSHKPLFILKGYAGTGKTTMVSSLVQILPALKQSFMLLAPTGRAAKVLANYSGKKAFTIHKRIYRITTKKDGGILLLLQKNYHKNTLFIVDEASMIPDDSKQSDYTLFSNNNLLDDLINYVYSGGNCKLIFIGDTAQLPPVGISLSPALDREYLKSNYSFSFYEHELKQVVRQTLESGILMNATKIRMLVAQGNNTFPFFNVNDKPDVIKIMGSDLEEALMDNYSYDNEEDTIIVCRSNKRANIYNQEIRKRILFREGEISSGDYLMVVKNNYFWLSPESSAGFIANGDIIEILRIGEIYDRYGFRFADVSIRLIDYPEEKDIEVRIMLSTIMAETPALSYEENGKLFNEVLKDYEDIPQRRARVEKVKNNPDFNALQVKFAYALTCHKSQGGQWKNVFVDQGYITDEMINTEYMRWLYTALTRATKKLFLINFHEKFFEE